MPKDYFIITFGKDGGLHVLCECESLEIAKQVKTIVFKSSIFRSLICWIVTRQIYEADELKALSMRCLSADL